MGVGTNKMIEPGNLSVAAPYFVSTEVTLGALTANDVFFALRNAGFENAAGSFVDMAIAVSRIRVAFAASTAYTAGSIMIAANKAVTSAQHSNGSQLVIQKRKTTGFNDVSSSFIDAKSGTALSGGTYTVASGAVDVAVGASSTLPSCEFTREFEDLLPLVIQKGEGLIVRAPVVPGGSGTGVVHICVDFFI
jgi:hypothetical protein